MNRIVNREEQIKEAARIRADQFTHPVDWNMAYHRFIDGGKWADSNPNPELKKQWLEKACEWLGINTLSAFNLDLGHTDMLREFIDNFKEAMK